MSTRRETLKGIRGPFPKSTNSGLWLDKFIANLAREDTESRPNLVRQVAEIGMPPEYRHWFSRWKQALREFGALFKVAETKGRLSIGLGEDSVLETSLALHHTYGVPYIPGSALKGLAASFCRQYLHHEEWGENSHAFRTVFGDTKCAGYITFFDALPLPNSFSLHPDTITVHHREYYQGKNSPPADWDSPNPVPFISVKGRFLIALAGPKNWVEATFSILEEALSHLGIGARTSSGYGRMRFVPQQWDAKGTR